eukprot:4035633-Pleurochrysis_carterae.AAC.1
MEGEGKGGRMFNTAKGGMCRRHLEIYQRATKWASQTVLECTRREGFQVGRSTDVNDIKQMVKLKE